MPTYSKETALYDTGAIATDITEAGQTAGRYITEIGSSGIKVHAEDNVNSDYTKIDATGMEVYQGGDIVANFGGITNIGAPNSSKITLSQDGMSAQSNEGVVYFNIDSNGGTETQRAYWERMTYEIQDTIIPNTDFVDVATFQLSENTSYSNLSTGSTFFLQMTFCTSKPQLNAYYSEVASDMIKGTSSTWSATRGYYYIKIIYNASSNTAILSLKRNSGASVLELWGHVNLNGTSTKSVVLPTYNFGINMPDNSNSLSVSMGDGTKACARGLAIGKYNEDGNYPFIIGGGTSTTPKTVFAVDWNGNIVSPKMAGVIEMFAGSTTPTGWLKCDGTSYLRTSYPKLFTALGGSSSPWGLPDSTHFNVPDLRGRAPIGAGTGTGLTARTLGTQNIGTENAIVPYHRHASYRYASSKLGSGTVGARIYDPTGSGGDSTMYTSYAGTSGNATGANMQPSAVVNFIICTGQ